MTKIGTTCFAVLLALVAAGIAIGGQKFTGTWKKDGSHTHINALCVQWWACDPGSVLHNGDERVVCTERKSARGTCSADNGPPDSCNSCVGAVEPKDSCQCEIVKKK